MVESLFLRQTRLGYSGSAAGVNVGSREMVRDRVAGSDWERQVPGGQPRRAFGGSGFTHRPGRCYLSFFLPPPNLISVATCLAPFFSVVTVTFAPSFSFLSCFRAFSRSLWGSPFVFSSFV